MKFKNHDKTLRALRFFTDIRDALSTEAHQGGMDVTELHSLLKNCQTRLGGMAQELLVELEEMSKQLQEKVNIK
jgi:hypothetical protein